MCSKDERQYMTAPYRIVYLNKTTVPRLEETPTERSPLATQRNTYIFGTKHLSIPIGSAPTQSKETKQKTRTIHVELHTLT